MGAKTLQPLPENFLQRFLAEKNIMWQVITAAILGMILPWVMGDAIHVLLTPAGLVKSAFLTLLKLLIPPVVLVMIFASLYATLNRTGKMGIVAVRGALFFAYALLAVLAVYLNNHLIVHMYEFNGLEQIAKSADISVVAPYIKSAPSLLESDVVLAVVLAILLAFSAYKSTPKDDDAFWNKTKITGFFDFISAMLLKSIKVLVHCCIAIVVFYFVADMITSGAIKAENFGLVTNIFLAIIQYNLTYCLICLVISALVVGWRKTLYIGRFALDVAFQAFMMGSTKAALPYAIERLQASGVDETSVRTYLPLGSALALGGTSTFMVAIASVMYMGLYGEVPDVALMLGVTIQATVMALGAAGIPKGTLLFLAPVLTGMNVPLELLPFIFAVDVLIFDRMRSAINMFDEILASYTIADYYGEVDDSVRTQKSKAA